MKALQEGSVQNKNLVRVFFKRVGHVFRVWQIQAIRKRSLWQLCLRFLYCTKPW